MQNKVFNNIMTGLNEAIEDAKSDKPFLKSHTVVVVSDKVYEAEEGKRICGDKEKAIC